MATLSTYEQIVLSLDSRDLDEAVIFARVVEQCLNQLNSEQLNAQAMLLASSLDNTYAQTRLSTPDCALDLNQSAKSCQEISPPCSNLSVM